MHHDIRHIMAKVDIECLLKKLNIRVKKIKKGHVIGWCPDHHLFTGKLPSHPKWEMDLVTGKTYCSTESRGSSILHIIRRLCECSLPEAMNILESSAVGDTSIIKNRIEQQLRLAQVVEEKKNPKDNKILQSLLPVIKEGFISERGFNYFKKNNIQEPIVKKFDIVEIKYGRYKDRVVVPFKSELDGELVGFVAIELKGKKQWVRDRVEAFRKFNEINDYKTLFGLVKKYWYEYLKVVFCKDSELEGHLFGLWELINDKKDLSEVILVEGERDALKMQQEGFNAVGTHGSRFSEGQKKLLKKHGVKTVCIAFDGDEPGRKATERVYNDIKDEFETFRINLPDGYDPKDYDVFEFLKLLKESKGGEKTESKLSDFLSGSTSKNFWTGKVRKDKIIFKT